MIRSSILLIALISLIYGSIFIFFPIWFVNYTNAENINIAWLRTIGASIVGLLFFGCLSIYYNPRGKLSLLRVISITSVLQTLTGSLNFSIILSNLFIFIKKSPLIKRA